MLLTIFVLGPSLAEFIRQSVIRNFRGIRDVGLRERCPVDGRSFMFLFLYCRS